MRLPPDAAGGHAGAAPGLAAAHVALMADDAAVAEALAQLGELIGLAPGEVARRRLQRHPGLLLQVRQQPPDIDHPAWADLIDAVTVQETHLFRHPAQCRLLHEAAMPALIAAARQRGARRLRLLSAGCASGEEAWTLAAIAATALQGGTPTLGFEVVGVDLSRPALQHAAAARYAALVPDPLRDVPADLLSLFPRQGASFGIDPALQRRTRFRRGNLLTLSAEGPGFDAISCRNVGVYLTDAARAAVVRRLAAMLQPGGVLMLGPTDRVPSDAGLQPWSAEAVSLYRAPPLQAGA